MTPIRLARRVVLPLLALAAAGCGREDDLLPVCPATLSLVAVPSVIVEVTDSITGAPRAAGASGWAVTGGRSVALVPPPLDAANLPTMHAYGPAGRYTVLVTRPGYAAWAASGVRVESDGCQPRTVTLRARLQPVPAGAS